MRDYRSRFERDPDWLGGRRGARKVEEEPERTTSDPGELRRRKRDKRQRIDDDVIRTLKINRMIIDTPDPDLDDDWEYYGEVPRTAGGARVEEAREEYWEDEKPRTSSGASEGGQRAARDDSPRFFGSFARGVGPGRKKGREERRERQEVREGQGQSAYASHQSEAAYEEAYEDDDYQEDHEALYVDEDGTFRRTTLKNVRDSGGKDAKGFLYRRERTRRMRGDDDFDSFMRDLIWGAIKVFIIAAIMWQAILMLTYFVGNRALRNSNYENIKFFATEIVSKNVTGNFGKTWRFTVSTRNYSSGMSGSSGVFVVDMRRSDGMKMSFDVTMKANTRYPFLTISRPIVYEAEYSFFFENYGAPRGTVEAANYKFVRTVRLFDRDGRPDIKRSKNVKVAY